MTFTKSVFAAAAMGCMLASTVSAHMVITSPVPYGQSSLTNSPLINDGSDFPCKQRSGVYDITSMNHMPVGVPQSLAFMGGATHGGGSCQVSVTLDKEPDKNSEWKVIHSIIGGCPSNATGNLAEDASSHGAAVFEFTMPKGMPNGQYSLAWTWFNKIGNREMYMNCAPITVTGGASDNKVFDSLPDMFVINIPNEDCATVEGEDFQFPSPGDSVETPFSTALGSKTVGSGCASVTAKGAGSGSAGSAASATGAASAASDASGSSETAAPSAYTQASTPAAPASQATDAPASGSPLVTVTTMSTITGAASSAAAPSAVATSAPSDGSGSSPGGSSNGTDSSSSGSGSGTGSCSNSGSVVCNGPNMFGLCNAGSVVWQPVAAGTTCSGGQVVKKRSMRHFRRHIDGKRNF